MAEIEAHGSSALFEFMAIKDAAVHIVSLAEIFVYRTEGIDGQKFSFGSSGIGTA
jgi:hypothetical protein